MPAGYTKAEKLQRARVVLPLEMAMHSLLFGMAILAGAINSGIYRMFDEQSNTTAWVAAPWIWALSVGVVALWGLMLAIGEWFFGEDWINADVNTSCHMRSIASFFGVFAWLDLGITVYGYMDANKAEFPLVFGPIFIFFHGVCFCYARRVIVILDPAKDTTKYEAEQTARRNHVGAT